MKEMRNISSYVLVKESKWKLNAINFSNFLIRKLFINLIIRFDFAIRPGLRAPNFINIALRYENKENRLFSRFIIIFTFEEIINRKYVLFLHG